MRFPDFNDEWKETTLGEIGKTYTGLSGKSSEDFGKGSPYITYKMVYDGVKINLCNTEYVYVSESEKQNQVRLGDILFTTSSETPEETGLCSVLLSSSDELYLNSFCFGYKLNEESLATSIFLGYALRSPLYRIKLSTLAQGSTRYNISKSEVMRMPLSLPSLAEQKRIADFLSLIDERIQSCSETIRELKNQKAALLNQLFSQKLRFPDFTDEWTQTTLGEICSVLGGGTPRTEIQEYWNGDIQWFTPSEIGLNKFVSYSDRTITTEGLNNSGAKLLPIGTILLTTRATIGEMSIATTPCTTNQGFQSLVVDSRYTTTEFIYQKGKTLKNELFTRANGSTFKEISATEIRSLPISLPSLEEQKKIADFLSLIDERIEVEERLLQQYEKQKRYLLRQMFV